MTEQIKKILKKLRAVIYRISHSGNERECPICGTRYDKFGNGGVEKREDAQCMNCGSLERHRFLWLYLLRVMKINQITNLSILHFAPDKIIEKKLRNNSSNYVSADIDSNKVDLKTDITRTPFFKESFNLILCSHVLEHVIDDRKALNELIRILKADGTLIIIIPVERKLTFEDPEITDPEDRLRVFGQRDHVRIYGEDFIYKLIDSGFNVKAYVPRDLYDEDERIKYGIKIDSDRLYVCKK